MNAKRYDEKIEKLKNKVLCQRGKEDRGIFKTLEGLLAEGERLGDPALIGYACYYLADSYFSFNESIETMTGYLTRGLQEQKTAGDVTLAARSYNLLGVVEQLRGNQVLASDYYMTALHYSRLPEADSQLLGIVSMNLGQLLSALGDYEGTLSYARESLPSILSQKEDARYHSNLFENYVVLSMTLLDIGRKEDQEEAIRYYRLAEELLPRLTGLSRDMGNVEHQILKIRILYSLGMEKELQQVIEKFLQLVHGMGCVPDMAENLYHITRFFLRMERLDIAKRLLDEFRSWDLEDGLSGVQRAFTELHLEYCDRMGMVEERNRYAHMLFCLEQHREKDYLSAIQIRRDLEQLHVENELMEAENVRLLQRADYDELTGLPNRYHLNRYSEDVFLKAYEQQQSIAFEMLDIDFFKHYNDSFGHQVGDACLRAVGHVLRRLCEDNEGIYAARYGGDEFVLIYLNMDDATVMRHAEYIKSTLDETLLAGKETPGISISQGIRNAVPIEKNRVWDFTYAADGALYQVKKNGRGSICLVHKSSVQPW